MIHWHSLFKLGVIVAILSVTALAAISLSQHTTYAPVQTPPRSAAVPGVHGTAYLTWGTEQDVLIESTSPESATAGLGFAHGWQHAMMMALLRQAALGKLAEWFGPQALPADSLTRSLGLATLAQESQGQLSPENLAYLHAYAAGVTTAWADPSIAIRRELLTLRHVPSPWHPWHTLAVERLIDYLAAEVPCTVRSAFCAADRILREMLYLDGFSGSLAWMVRQDSTVAMYHRQVYGNSAISLFQEVTVRVHDQPPIIGSTLVGTPFFSGGQSERGGWAVLLGSSAQIIHGHWQPTHSSHARLQDDTGIEYVSSFYRTNGRLHVATTSDTTAWFLEWDGLAPGSDTEAWRALPQGKYTPFRLFTTAQLRADVHGQWHMTGSPPVIRQSPDGILISRDTMTQHLPLPDTSWFDVRAWATDLHSAYAQTVLPPLLDTIRALPSTYSEAVSDALVLLDNWDFRYTEMSIASSVFTEWMHALDADTSATDAQTLPVALEQALNALSTSMGPSSGDWRWGESNPDRRFFSVARHPAGAELPVFAPMEWPREGHSSTPRWGPSGRRTDQAAPSAAMELWYSIPQNSHATVRRIPFVESGYTRRRALLLRDVPIFTVPSEAAFTTTLNP